jgi:hypothetical protein
MLFIAMFHVNVSLSICCRECRMLLLVDMPIQMASWRVRFDILFLTTIAHGNHFPLEVGSLLNE